MTAVLSPALVELGFSDFSPDNIDEQLPKIINTILEDNNNPSFLQLMTVVFGQLASQFEMEILDLKLLQHVLPPMRSAFVNCLLEVGNLLGDSDDMDEETAISISKSLQACLDILSGYGELLEVISKDNVPAEQVRSLNCNLPPILIEAFSHCKDSENCYGVYFEESTTILTAFFKKSYEIQTKYYKLLEDKIVFSSTFEEDLTCLVEVLESVLKITKTVVALDIKSCVDQWKLYARLYSKHISDLKSRTDLSQPLALLTSNVQRILQELSSNQDTSDKQVLKLLKMGNFLLKMIVKLCELSECRFREGMKDMVELLLLLHSCSKTYDLTETLREEVRRFICVGSAPLLALFLKEEDFFKAYNNVRNTHDELTAVSKVGLIFLSLSIMKNVVEEKAPSFWNGLPLIELVVELYGSCGLMMDMNSNFEGNDSYTGMISSCAAFMIATLDESSFPKLESYLVSKLFNGKLHTSLFVCDYLCLVGRLTNDNYCLHLASSLCEALKQWPEVLRNRSDYKVIGSLVLRLSKLLSPRSQEALNQKYTLEGSLNVHYLLNGTGSYAQAVLTKFERFCRQPSVTSFNILMAHPPPEKEYDIDPSDYELISKTFDNVKNIISYVSSHKETHNDLWYQKVLLYSLKLLSPLVPTTPADVTVKVLDKLINLLANSEGNMEFLVFLFLSKTAKSLGNISQTNPSFALTLSRLIVRLMESQNELVSASTLDVWIRLENKQLKQTVSADSNLRERFSRVTSALQRTNSPANTSFYSLINSLPEPELHCCKRCLKSPTEVDVPPAKKMKTDSATDSSDSPITEIIHRLKRDVSILKSTCSLHKISYHEKIQLNAVIKDLSSLVD